MKKNITFVAMSLLVAMSTIAKSEIMTNHMHKIGDCSNPMTCGLNPADFRSRYSMVGVPTGAGTTVALIEAFHDPETLNNVQHFSYAFGLPQFNKGAGTPTLSIVQAQPGAVGYNEDWAFEENLDVQGVHAIAPMANIMVVVAKGPDSASLGQAIHVAVANGAKIISMSFSGPETSFNLKYITADLNNPNVTFIASTGDSGTAYGVGVPATHPNVVAVGGTALANDQIETGWTGSTGGYSAAYPHQAYQAGFVPARNRRAIPDISMDANPYSGLTTMCEGRWWRVGGTSLASPMFAGVVALATQLKGRPLTHVLGNLYLAGRTYPQQSFNDVIGGSNGGYDAIPGYDLVTGLGTPKISFLIQLLANGR